MDTALILLAMAALGSQWGYQTADDGTAVYTIQLRPQEALDLADSPGTEIVSYVPVAARPIGKIRLVVGERPLPRGGAIAEAATADTGGRFRETQSRIASIDLESDLAGKLVAVPPVPGSARLAERQEDLQLTRQNGAALQADQTDQTNQTGGDSVQQSSVQSEAGRRESEQDVARDSPADPGAAPPMQREGLTHPVYTAEEPGNSSNEGTESKVSSFQASEMGGPSPSVRSEKTGSPAGPSPAAEPGDDRPWPPLVATTALALALFAGNVFQWRSYVSLRKRYLHLLRKTGG